MPEPKKQAPPMLELRGLTVSFGGLTAVDGLDFHVGEKEIVSLIGPNGAGKTTVINLITGVTRPRAATSSSAARASSGWRRTRSRSAGLRARSSRSGCS